MKVKTSSYSIVSKTRDENALEKEFNEILLKALDEALAALGTSIKDALYFHLEVTFGVKKESICRDPKQLSDGLERIFGLGAKFLENLIVDSISNKIGCKPNSNWQECSFEERLLKIKELYVQTKARTT